MIPVFIFKLGQQESGEKSGDEGDAETDEDAPGNLSDSDLNDMSARHKRASPNIRTGSTTQFWINDRISTLQSRKTSPRFLQRTLARGGYIFGGIVVHGGLGKGITGRAQQAGPYVVG
jgi:hypothetical protein